MIVLLFKNYFILIRPISHESVTYSTFEITLFEYIVRNINKIFQKLEHATRHNFRYSLNMFLMRFGYVLVTFLICFGYVFGQSYA